MTDTHTPEAAIPATPVPPPPPHYATPPALPASLQKNPATAAFLAVMPGLGHVYCGLYQRGIFFLLAVAGCITLVAKTGWPLFGFAIPFFWLFNMIDAYRQATLINHGYATDLGLSDRPQAARPGQGNLAAGFVLIAIGMLALLERLEWFDWQVVWDNWMFGLILIGAWMVVSALRERSRQREQELSL